MLLGLYIIVDEDIGDPVYSDPPVSELDDALVSRIGELVQDVADGEIDARGTLKVGEALIAWRSLTKTGITFVAAVTDDVRAQAVELYLQKIAKRYMDEVDDPRSPDRAGVSEVVVDVIPPWEAEDED
jgi:hypothetical protein